MPDMWCTRPPTQLVKGSFNLEMPLSNVQAQTTADDVDIFGQALTGILWRQRRPIMGFSRRRVRLV